MTSLSPCLSGTISPSTSLASPDATDMWTPSNAALLNYSSSSYAYDNQSSLSTTEVYNESVSHLASLTSFKEIPPLSFRLTGCWDETTQSEKDVCIQKASEACQVICEVIAPNAGKELFQAMNSTSDIHVLEELAALMTAYKTATTRNLNVQILSIYAHNYPAKTLMKLHEPYATVPPGGYTVAYLKSTIASAKGYIRPYQRDIFINQSNIINQGQTRFEFNFFKFYFNIL